MNLPDIELITPCLHKFTMKSLQTVQELTPVEKDFIVDGNQIKGFINEVKLVKKEVDITVEMIADKISGYEVAHEPRAQRLAVRYWHGFYNNGIFNKSDTEDSIMFNGAGYRAAGFDANVTPAVILAAIMKYKNISGTIVS